MHEKPGNCTDASQDHARTAALLTQLAARERQLHDLTEQALSFLEQLAESRRVSADREALAHRIGELERQLAETRARLRHAGGVAAEARPADATATRPLLEVVFWGATGHEDAVASLAARGDCQLSWIGVPSARPAGEPPAGLQLLVHRDAHTAAQCFNLGMAATTAEVVLFVGPGLRLSAPVALPAPLSADVALLAPRIDQGATATLGLREQDELLHLTPATVGDPTGSALPPVDWPAAAAFGVRRSAFEQIGMFDEGLGADATLIDYTLRARARNFTVVGAPGIAIADAPDATDPPAGDTDRLLLLAKYRPERLGEALAKADALWELGPDALPDLLARLFAAMGGADAAVSSAALAQVANGLARHTLPTRQFCDRLRQLRLDSLRSLAAQPNIAARDAVLAAIQHVEREADASGHGDPRAALDLLVQDLELLRRCAVDAAGALRGVIDDRSQIDADRHAHMARAEHAEGARAATQRQLEQVETWLREAQADLRRLNEHQQEIERQVLHSHQAAAAAAEHATRQLADLEHRVADLQHRLDRRELEVRELRSALSASSLASGLHEAASPGELQQKLVALARDAAELSELQQRFAGIEQSAKEHQQAVAARDETIAALQRTIAERDASVAAFERAAAERDSVIADLLLEVGRRRLFPRALQPHEQALLDRLRRSP